MRILLVTARYLPHRGGLESVVQYLAREFRSQGHQVRIITNRYPRSLPQHEMIDGVSVDRLHFLLPSPEFLRQRRPDLFLAGLFYGLWTRYTLDRIIRDFQPDVINSHYLNEAADFVYRVLRPGSHRRFPWVVSLHGGDVDGEPRIDQGRMRRFCSVAGTADLLTACSHHLARQAVELEPSIAGKLQVIHNGVDIDLFVKAKAFSHSIPYIFAVGQLAPHKGFDLLIKAFSQVASKYPHINLMIAGEGPYRPQLEELIENAQLQGRACLLGKVDASQVASLMAGSLFVNVPSLREPFGIVALEAMASGRAVLATPVGGLPEFLPCPPNRMIATRLSDWATALDEWLTQAASGDLRAEGNLTSASSLNWSLVAKRYFDTFERAMAHG